MFNNSRSVLIRTLSILAIAALVSPAWATGEQVQAAKPADEKKADAKMGKTEPAEAKKADEKKPAAEAGAAPGTSAPAGVNTLEDIFCGRATALELARSSESAPRPEPVLWVPVD